MKEKDSDKVVLKGVVLVEEFKCVEKHITHKYMIAISCSMKSKRA